MHVILLLGAVASASAFFESIMFGGFQSNCTFGQVPCRNGRCIANNLRCNGANDCGDASDEQDCELYLCKEPKYFRCKNNRCISKAFVCDGENDCEDFSDETKCDSFKLSDHVNSTCDKGLWQCTDKLCIPDEWVCNGELDCLDGSDEGIGCSSNIECDGFKCKNNHCVPNEWRCDGQDDCHDKSDEIDCENHVSPQKCGLDENKFLCSNNITCIEISRACDGKFDCSDKSDEGSLCKNSPCSSHGCSHRCVQLPTGPKCLCPIGYHTIDDNRCKDINECETFGICDQKCRNTEGSYQCYCDDGYVLQKDKKTCKAPNDEGMLVFSSKTEIRVYTLTSQYYFPVAKNLKQVVGVEYDGNHIYWTEVFAEHESIVRANIDGSNRELIVTSGLSLPEDLTVDWLTNNIYFTDAEKQHIGVCTNDGIHCTVLRNKDVRKPRGIVLNVAEGNMYWSDWEKPAEIAFSLMDGTKYGPFVTNDIHWPNGLALDYPNSRLYWTDARKMSLESIRLDGTDRRIILEGIVKHPYSIDVFEGQIYWSDWATHSIQACDKFTGKNHHTILKENGEYIYGISIFHPALRKRINNPCAFAYCSDICLLSGTSYTCACPQNKVLGPDRHKCIEVNKKQSLVLGAKDLLIHIEHQLIGRHDINYLPVSVKNVGCMTFDPIDNAVLVSDLEIKKIVKVNLNTGVSKVMDINGLENIVAMEYDPKGNNLYLCDKDRATLEVVDLNTMARKILLHDTHGEIPESIALVPEEGVMFVALRKRDAHISHIDRISMDGTARTHTIDSGLKGPISLHYDSNLKWLLFADANTGNIERINIQNNDRHGFRSLTTTPVGLTSLDGDIFWVNENSRRLFWAEKNSTISDYNKKITLDIPSDIIKLHITSITPKSELYSLCHINNGNCSHLCLVSHGSLVCACPAGFEMSHDGQTCTKRARCDPDSEFLCSNSNACILKGLRCDGHRDCFSGEDEENCAPIVRCPTGHFQCKDGQCIEDKFVCDRKFQCRDKSDESMSECLKKNKDSGCPALHFECGDKTCLSERYLCDGYTDCKDSSDEDSINCKSSSCGPEQFRCESGACIPKSWECDHEYDCSDNSDEHFQCPSVTCASHQHTCSNGRCVDVNLVCDHVDDCGDNSDELNCYSLRVGKCGPEEFACTSNKTICLPHVAKCNGTSECPHHEDEKDCSDCNVDEFSCDNKKCIPTQWICDHMDDCGDRSDEKPEFCSHSVNDLEAVVSISCENKFRCKSGHCIDFSLVCDGKHHCYDGSDEDGLCSSACSPQKNSCSQECIPTPAGSTCRCKNGYELKGDGYTCQDIDECQKSPPVCSQLCHNSVGSYTCDCYEGYLIRTDKQSCKAEGEPMSLIFTSDNQIRELSQKSNSLHVLYDENVPKITGLRPIDSTNQIYFSIETTGTIHRLDFKTQTRQYMENLGRPKQLAVDWSTHNVYFFNSDTQDKAIYVCNFDERLCARLIDVDMHRQVSAIAVDSVNKVMFYALANWWVFKTPSYVIYKSYLDGTGLQELVKTTSGFISGLTFDLDKKQLYFVDQASRQIGSINYEGKSKGVLFTNVTHANGLDFYENQLFYMTDGGYVTSCKLYDALHCNTFKLAGSSGDLFAIVQNSIQPQKTNVCLNHTCSSLCLSGSIGFKCLCKDGQVVSSGENCPSGNKRESVDDNRMVHSVGFTRGTAKKEGGHVVLAILIPIFLLGAAGLVAYVIKKRNSANFNVSVKFLNPTFRRDTLERPILQPNQHEYTNPIRFEDHTDSEQKTLDQHIGV